MGVIKIAYDWFPHPARDPSVSLTRLRTDDGDVEQTFTPTSNVTVNQLIWAADQATAEDTLVLLERVSDGAVLAQIPISKSIRRGLDRRLVSSQFNPVDLQAGVQCRLVFPKSTQGYWTLFCTKFTDANASWGGASNCASKVV